MRYTVLAVGRIRPPFADGLDHYGKLLAGHAKIDLVEVREDVRVERRIPPRSHRVLLDAGGKTYDSPAFARWIQGRREAARDVCFVVGGPYGTELERWDEKLSFGPMTFPHQLARVMLVEQLYRAHKILAGEPYHH